MEHIKSSERGPQYNIGSVVGNVAFGDHAHQSAQVQNDMNELGMLLKRIVDSLPDLDLDSRRRGDAERAASQASDENSRREPDRNRLAAALRILRTILASAGQTVLTSAIDSVLAKFGFPPG